MEKKENLRNEFVNKDNHNSKFRKADRSESEKYQIKEKVKERELKRKLRRDDF